jgi:uncharacterized RDD family membrane protein YckC
MGLWDDLTTRHKKYACYALLAGLLLGLVTSLTFIAVTAVVGVSLAGTGALGLFRLKNGDTTDKYYKLGLAISITCIASGLMCFAGACLGLYLHQIGVL